MGMIQRAASRVFKYKPRLKFGETWCNLRMIQIQGPELNFMKQKMPVKETASNHHAMYLSSTNLYIKACRHPGVSEAYMSDTFRKVISRELWKLYKIDHFF